MCEWHPISWLAIRWKTTTDDIEGYFIRGQLIPSIIGIEGVELYEVELHQDDYGRTLASNRFADHEPAEAALYDVLCYKNISWELSTSVNQKTATLTNLSRVFLSKNNRHYSFAQRLSLI